MTLIFDCSACQAMTQGEVLKIRSWEDHDSDTGMIDAAIECVRCKRMFATHCTYDLYDDRMDSSWMIGADWVNGAQIDHNQILEDTAQWWPTRSSAPAFDRTPAHVRGIADEAYRCFDNACYAASVVMARAAIEAVAKERGATKGTLAEKITTLKRLDLINAQAEKTFKMLDAIRANGNLVAHADPNVSYSKDEAKMVLVLLRLILESVYDHAHLVETVTEMAMQKKAESK